MPSIKLPGITDTAITRVKELLAFTTLPYYQVSGVLKKAEGEVKIGDPIAWEVATKQFIIFDADPTDVEDEAVGSGDGTVQEFDLDNDHIKLGTLVITVAAGAQIEYEDYVCDYETGKVRFYSAPASGAIVATYSHFGDAAVCVGFVRIPGDSTDKAVAIEVVIGGAVKYSVISVASNYDAKVLTDLKANYSIIADAVIF